jgi:hypothetical protein
MKKYLKYLFIIIGIIFIAIVVLGLFQQKNVAKNLMGQSEDAIQSKTITTTSVDFNGYKINFTYKTYENGTVNYGSEISIEQNGNQVWEKIYDEDFSGFYVNEVGDSIKNADDLKNKAIKDINNDGIPELVIKGYSGGAHCCSHLYIVELNNPISILLDLETGDWGTQFEDLNNDGVYEISTKEDVFTYWHTSFAASPAPDVVLSFRDGKYKADPKYMRKSAPTDAEIKTQAGSVESWSSAQGPEVAWEYAIKLIYSGNIASARKYVDLCWQNNAEFESKNKFWEDLFDTIKNSPYYDDLSPYLGV